MSFYIKAKNIFLSLQPHVWLGWTVKPFRIFANMVDMSKWMAEESKNKTILNDFYTSERVYEKRLTLFSYVSKNNNLIEEPIDYLEFGVSSGASFQWWMQHNKNPQSTFNGFDTFEGLPEDWGVHEKGAFAAKIPTIPDERGAFQIGLFQDTLPKFIKEHTFNTRRKIIHLDADMYSSTLYAMTSLAPYLNKGDILFFDEFNVPNHEYLAYKNFIDSYYVKFELLGAVNNFYQVAFMYK